MGGPAVCPCWYRSPAAYWTFLMRHVLIQTPPANDANWTPVLVGCLILIVVVVLGLLTVSWIKRRMQAAEEPVPAGFTLSDLRQLHKAGQITDEEFERAKAKTIERYKAKEKVKQEVESGGLKGFMGNLPPPEFPDEDGKDLPT